MSEADLIRMLNQRLADALAEMERLRGQLAKLVAAARAVEDAHAIRGLMLSHIEHLRAVLDEIEKETP